LAKAPCNVPLYLIEPKGPTTALAFYRTVDFFSWHKELMEIVDLGLETVEAVVASDGYAMLETDYTVPKDYCVAMEGQSMIVYDDRITWEAYPKNTGIIITTYSVSLELLRGLAIR